MESKLCREQKNRKKERKKEKENRKNMRVKFLLL